MDFYAMTDQGIGVELGKRIKRLRLRKNYTQQELADRAVISVNAIKSVEAGRGKLLTIIGILRHLDALDALNNFIPDIPISPMQMAKLGKQRERASGKRIKPKKGKSSW